MTVNEMKTFKKEDFDAEENIKQTLWKRKKCPGDGPAVWSSENNLSFEFKIFLIATERGLGSTLSQLVPDVTCLAFEPSSKFITKTKILSFINFDSASTKKRLKQHHEHHDDDSPKKDNKFLEHIAKQPKKVFLALIIK